MNSKRNDIYKILFSIYCIICIILILYMSLSYGYSYWEIQSAGKYSSDKIVEYSYFYDVSCKDLLFGKDKMVFDITMSEIRELMPGAIILIWVCISLIFAALVLAIIDVLKNKKVLSFIGGFCVVLAFFLLLFLPAFYHSYDEGTLRYNRYLVYPLEIWGVGFTTAILVTFFEGRHYIASRRYKIEKEEINEN